ncbi:MAG: YybH family protein, partial [Aeromicrobium sp.]
MRKVVVVMLVAVALAGSTVVAFARAPTFVLHRQPTVEAVVAEHISALNACDVERLMAQYPSGVVIITPAGGTTAGRTAVRALFEGFCKTRAEGGLRGLKFTEVKSWKVGDTI